MKRFFLISAVMLALFLLFTACGNNSDSPDTEKDTPTASHTDSVIKTEGTETTVSPIETDEPKNEDWPDESQYDFFQVFEAPKESPRDAVLNYMREMATVEWTPAFEWTTSHGPGEGRELNVDHTYLVGKTYYGIPYANTGSSLDGFLSVLENGVYSPSSTYYNHMIGNQCSSSMDRAFEQIVDINGFGGILPEWNAEQLMYPVGSGIEAPEGWTHDTTLIAEHSGKDKMFAGYAALDKGDILYYTAPSGGHTRMVSGVEIIKNPAGTINYDKSTVSVIEQTNAWYTSEENTTWFVDKKYSFRSLLESGFIPVTLKVYHDEDFESPDAYIAFDGKNTPELLKKGVIMGMVSSNFSFSYVRITITDSSGNVAAEWAEYENVNAKGINIRQAYFDMKTFPPGTYTYTLRAGIARGGCEIESVEFTIE